MMRRAARPAAVVALSLMAAACTVGPNYRKPDLPTPATYAEAKSTPRTRVNTADADLSAWWSQFHDPVLDRLITRALADNLDVQTALSRVRESRQVERQTAAAEYPSLGATANALTFHSNRSSPSAPSTSSGTSSASASPPGSIGFTAPNSLNVYSIGFDASWEVDLFGGTRRAIQQARANTQAQEWALRDIEVTLTAEVANDYLTLRTAQARIAIGEAELTRQRGLFTLVQARRQTGFVTNLDVNQQSTAVATAAAQIPQLQAQARTQIHAIGVLLGEPPEALSQELSAQAAIPPPPPTLPLGLPSELLERRPDVREAERRLAAATAGIGVETANLYPKLTLYPFAGFVRSNSGALFDIHSLAAAGLATLTQPIFDAGRRIASVRAAREEREQAFLAYKSAVLGSLQDVEDALSRYENEESRRTSLIQAVTAAKGSLAIAQDQYTTGFTPFINVLQSEYALLNAEDQLTQSDAAVATDLVSVYKALGGGWSR